MYPETINSATKRVWEKIVENSLAKDFYLVGGTALAIQMGHRESIDLDWFGKGDFDVKRLKEKLSDLGELRIEAEEESTLHASLDRVKVTFLSYSYPLIFPLIDFEGGFLADKRDIATMKLDAISSRGSKKDFVDLYFLLKEYSLGELLGLFERKYRGIKYNQLHLIKSLTYFKDAEEEPLPKMIQKVSWEGVKSTIQREVKKLV